MAKQTIPETPGNESAKMTAQHGSLKFFYLPLSPYFLKVQNLYAQCVAAGYLELSVLYRINKMNEFHGAQKIRQVSYCITNLK